MVACRAPVVFALACALLTLGRVHPAYASEDDGEPPFVLPSTIQVDALLEPVMVQMLEKSRTFRRQCREIGSAKGVVVAVHLVPTARDLNTHAHATLRRYSSGLVIAHVEVPAATSLPELIAHEFEHIAEFIEGVDLHELVARRPSEGIQRPDGAFETWRAVTAGKAVHAEVTGKSSSR